MKRIEIDFDLEVFGLGIGAVFNNLDGTKYSHKLSIHIFHIWIDIVLFRTKNKLFIKKIK